MKFELKENDGLFIANPEYSDIAELKIQFTEIAYGTPIEGVKLLFLAQILGLDDMNSFDSYILYEKDGELYNFHEHENNATMSYHVEHEKSSVKHFLTLLDNYDDVLGNNFFKNAQKQYNYHKLNQEVVEKEESTIRRNKI